MIVRRIVPVICLLLGVSLAFADDDTDRLAAELKPLWSCLNGRTPAFSLTAEAAFKIQDRPQKIEATLARFDDDSFDLEAKHPEYHVRLRRRADATEFALPLHQTAFVGRGAVDAKDHLAPVDLSLRLISAGSQAATYAPLAQQQETLVTATMLTNFLGVKRDAETGRWTAPQNVAFAFTNEGRELNLTVGEVRVRVTLAAKPPVREEIAAQPETNTIPLERRELERQLARGFRRALEVLAPSAVLTAPKPVGKQVPHGELLWLSGQRVVLLSGTPEQIGRAHGELLKAQADRCIDSVLYAFGTVQTVRTGRWFRHEVDAAYKRLSPHIPEHHKQETRALAAALGYDADLVEAINVFPELFHCSGFAVSGKATADGKLYHGRVLDYMTTIGLQDAAVTFIVAPAGKIPFANVGYAGFIGSVSGMNAKGISLGEMGGRGEGKWDGAPMATLMRRALEEATTLDEVTDLWQKSPRTCEYYYVFADGKTNRAVGVAATPEKIEFVRPGQSDDRLGPGIEDAVVLSAGDRLQCLRDRVKADYGRIDEDVARRLMSRPVAMESNLHNVLFVPADGILFVANADHKKCAADRPYVRLDLRELLEKMKDGER